MPSGYPRYLTYKIRCLPGHLRCHQDHLRCLLYHFKYLPDHLRCLLGHFKFLLDHLRWHLSLSQMPIKKYSVPSYAPPTFFKEPSMPSQQTIVSPSRLGISQVATRCFPIYVSVNSSQGTCHVISGNPRSFQDPPKPFRASQLSQDHSSNLAGQPSHAISNLF